MTNELSEELSQPRSLLGGLRKRWLLWVALLAFLVFGYGAVDPINDTINRLAMLSGLFGLWLLALIGFWKWPLARWVFIGVAMLVVLACILPGSVNSEELRQTYLSRLRSYDGVRYYWGGESKRGIDCSGLPRRAMQEALLWEGVTHADGKSVRMAINQWWYDTSARAFGAGYRDQTVPLGIKGKISELSKEGLLPGDLAVTSKGIHLISYFGDGYWIQADPSQHRVAIQHGKRDENPWFTRSVVTLHRWALLERSGE